MNHVYKVVYCKSTGTFVAVSEMAKSQGKKGSGAFGSISDVVGDVSDAGAKFAYTATAAGVMMASAPSAIAATVADGAGASSIVINPSGGTAATAVSTHAIAAGDSASVAANSSGAIAFGQNSTVAENSAAAVALGQGANASGANATALGSSANATAENAIGIGKGSNASKANAVAIGQGATSAGTSGVAIGKDANSAGVSSAALGHGATSSSLDSLALGHSSRATATNTSAVGALAKAEGEHSTALGSGAQVAANTKYAVALGAGAKSDRNSITPAAGTNANNVAVSNPTVANKQVYALASTSADDKQAIAGTLKGDWGAVSVGDTNNTRQIINVAAGTLDSDAVNVSQLKAVGNALSAATATTPLSVSAGGAVPVGKVNAPADANKLVKAGDIANAINNSGHTVRTVTGTGGAIGSDLINPGDTLTFKAGTGVTLAQTGSEITINATGGTGSAPTTVKAGTGTVVTGSPTAGYTVSAAPDVISGAAKGATAVQQFTVSTQSSTGTQKGTATVKDNGAIKFKEGNNVTLTQTGDTITINAAGGTGVTTKLANGANTTVSGTGTTTDPYKVNVAAAAALNANPSGAIVAPTTGGSLFMTATNVANAINKSGFMVAGHNGVAVDTINPGDKIAFVNGNNTTTEVFKEGGMTKIKINATGGAGGAPTTVKAAAGSPVTVTPTTTGASEYTVGVQTATLSSPTNGSLVAPSSGDAGKLVTAGNLVDVVNKSGFQVLNHAGSLVDTINPGNKVQFSNGKGTTATTTGDAASGTTTVKYDVNIQGAGVSYDSSSNTYNIAGGTGGTANIANGNNTTVTGTGTSANPYKVNVNTTALDINKSGAFVSVPTAQANNLVTADNLVKSINRSGFMVAGNDGVAVDTVNPGNKIEFVNGTNTTTEVTSANGVTKVKINATGGAGASSFTLGTKATKQAGDPTVSNGEHVAIVGADGVSTSVNANNVVTVALDQATRTQIAQGVAANTQANKAMGFAGDTGTKVTRKLGEDLNVKGGVTDASKLSNGNIGVVANAASNTLDVKLAKDLTDLTSATFGGVKVSGSTTGGNKTLSVDGAKISNVAAGTAPTDAVNVGQLANVGFNVKHSANGGTATGATTATRVNNDGEVEFVAGNNVTLNRDGSKITISAAGGTGVATSLQAGDNTTVSGTGTTANPYKVNVAASSALTVNSAGQVAAPAADGNKFVTATNVAKAINESGFTLKATPASGTATAGTLVNPGDVVNIKAGTGIDVEQGNDGTITIKSTVTGGTGGSPTKVVVKAGEKNLTADTAGDTVTLDFSETPTFTEVTVGDAANAPKLSSNAAGDLVLNAGGTAAAITGVKSNLKDTAAAASNPAGNARTDFAAVTNNAATVGDVLNAGFTVQGNGTATDFVTHGDTVNFTNGQGIVANVSKSGTTTTVKFDTPLTYVDDKGAASNTPSNSVNLVGADKQAPVKLGNVAAGTAPTDAVNVGQLANVGFNVAVNKTGTGTASEAAGINDKRVDNNNTFTFEAGDGIDLVQSNDKLTIKATGTGAVTKLQAGDNTSVTGTGTAADPYKVNVAAAAALVVDKAGKVTAPTTGGDHFMTATNVAKAINESGFNVTADGAGSNTTLVKAGETLTFTGEGGTTVTQKDGVVTIKAPAATGGTPTTVKQGKGVTVTGDTTAGYTVAVQDDVVNGAAQGASAVQNIIAQVDGADAKTLTKADNKLNFIDGTNIDVTNDGGKIKVSTKNDVTFTNTTTNTLTVPGTGTAKPVVINAAGINAGDKKITGVAAGTAPTDAVNVEQLEQAKTKVISSDASVKVTHDSATNTYDVKVVGSGVATTMLNAQDGKIDAPVPADADKLVTANDIAHAVNNTGFKVKAVESKGGAATAGELVLSGDDLVLAAGDNVSLQQTGNTITINATAAAGTTTTVKAGGKNVTVSPDTAGAPTYTVTLADDIDVTSVKAGDVNAGGVTINKDGINANNTAVTNLKSHLADTAAAATNPANNARKDFTQVANEAATVADVLNAGFNLQNNSADRDFVTHGDTVNFVDGKGTTAKVVTKDGVSAVSTDVNLKAGKGTTVEFDATDNSYVITATGTGAGSSPTVVKAANGSPVSVEKTVGADEYVVDLTQAAKDDIAAGVAAKNAVDTKGLTFTGDTGSTGVKKLGESVAVTGDSNITTTADAAGVKLALNKNITVDSVKAGTLNVGPVTVDAAGIKAGDTVIGGVKAGTQDGDAVNVKQLRDAVNKVNTAAGSWTIQGNGTDVDQVASADKVNFVDGDNTTVNVSTDATTNTTTVKYNVKTAPVTVAATGVANDVAPADAGKLVTAGDVATALNNIGFNLTAQGKNGSLVKAGQTVDMRNTDGNITIAKSANDNNVVYNLANDVKVAGSIGVTNGPSLSTNGVDAAGKKVTNVAAGTEAGDAVNVAQLNAAKVEVKAGTNVTVQESQGANGQTIYTVNSSFTPGTGSVTYNNADGSPAQNVTPDQQIKAVTDGNGNVSITNLADGKTPMSAVNLGQLMSVGDQLNKRIGDVEDDANAGTSSAMAMASLPQAYLPGKSMLTGGVASYNGQGAVAVGLSKLSDNGRWVLKVSGTADTKGNVGGAVGAGFHF